MAFTAGRASAQPEPEQPPPEETGEPSEQPLESTDPAAPSDSPPEDTTATPVTAPVVTPEPAPSPGPVAQNEPPPPLPTMPPVPPPHALGAYGVWYDAWLERTLSKPLWGQTAQLPEGVLKLRYKYGHARADKFYGRDGEELPLLPTIVLNDCKNSSDPNCQVTAIEPRVEGVGHTHTFQIAYGITDPLDVWVEIPFQKITSSMDLRLLMDGKPASDLTFAIFQQELESNGRPLPTSSFQGGMDMGDIRVGTSWNFHRTEYFSAVITPSVYLPTGKRADPNNDLTFLRGTQIDRGVGAWAVAFTNTIDVRPIEWFILNFEVTPSYRFGYHRDAPKWLPITNCKRLQGPDRPADCGSDYDPLYDLQQSQTFPNLEGLDDEYYVYPGMSLYAMAGFTLEIYHIPFQFGWGFNRGEATTIKATGEGDSGPAFEQLVRSLRLLEATEVHTLSAGVQIPLLPLYIPIMITPTYQHTIAGRNTMRLADQYSIAFELFLPVGDAF